MTLGVGLLPSASARLRRYVGDRERDPSVTCDRATLAMRLEAHGLPVREAWLDFEERFGGYGDYGIARWLDHRRARIEWGGRLLPLIRFHDLDFSEYLDEEGRPIHDTIGNDPFVQATSFDVYLESHALWAEVVARYGPHVGGSWVEWMTSDRAVLEALAAPRVDEASDALCARHWDGELYVAVVAPKVKLFCGDRERLIAKVVSVGARAPLTVFGWPNAETAELRRRLAAALSVEVAERNDYIGPLEDSDFLR